MRRFDSCIFCAILRRRPTILTSCVASEARRRSRRRLGLGPGAAAGDVGVEVGLDDPAGAAGAVTSRRSTPSSQARARTAGEAIGRCAADVDAGVGGRGDAGTAGAAGATARVEVGVDAGAVDAGVDACAGHRCRRGRRRRRRLGRRRPGRILDLDADQLRPDGEHLPDLAAEREHLAGDRRRDLDRGLVGHHVGEALVLDDGVADRDVPDDELDLGDAFAEVGDADDVDGHASA